MSFLAKPFAFFRALSVVGKIITSVAAVAVVVVGVHFVTAQPPAPAATDTLKRVHLASLASLADQTAALPVTGSVTSLSKANILAQSSGEVVALFRGLGDYVSAGAVIATLENSSQQASVLQAQGGYDAAQAALARARGATASNSNASSAQAAQNAANAKVSAVNAVASAAATLDDAVHTKVDTLFTNPRTTSATLTLLVPDSQLVHTITVERTTLEAVLADVSMLAADTNPADVDAMIAKVVANVQTVATFLDNVVEATNKAIPTTSQPASTIASYQTLATAARSEILGAISSLTVAKSAYDAAVSAATTAATSADAGTPIDIAAAEANVKSALGGLNAAKANLEKTIIRSPISGTIVSLPITRGQYVSTMSSVAQVSNPHALEVKAYVTASDAKTLSVGDKATIDDSTAGTIVFIAPALDPTTGKVEIKIGLPDGASALTDGATVRVSLLRAGVKSSVAATPTLTIPIIAAKITPAGPVVFTVSSSTLVATPITFGPILGDSVTVTSGISPETIIVTDARGLASGQKVTIEDTL